MSGKGTGKAPKAAAAAAAKKSAKKKASPAKSTPPRARLVAVDAAANVDLAMNGVYEDVRGKKLPYPAFLARLASWRSEKATWRASWHTRLAANPSAEEVELCECAAHATRSRGAKARTA
jgi:hypothetical protein